MRTKPSVQVELTWPQVHAFRVARHHLAVRAPKSALVDVVGAIGGAQAQVMSAAELQTAVRVRCSVRDVREALWTDRTLVKTWLMRGTLHLIPADDLPVYSAAWGAFKPQNSWFKYFRLTPAELDRFIDAMGQTLTDTPMTREQLIAVAGKGRSRQLREGLGSGWGGLLKPVARRGLLCFGPSRGTSVTFVRPQAWLGRWRELDHETAIAEVARRYLGAYGPATPADFARWFAPGWRAAARTAWAGLAGELIPVSIEGARADALATDVRALSRAARTSVQLLPPFDPYVMGHQTRDHLFERKHAPKVSRVAGWISAVVLVDGRVIGTWTYAVAGTTLRVTVAPFRPLSPRARSAVDLRAHEIARAMGLRSAEVTTAPRA